MKRILLTGAFLMALSFTANAQIITSFETADGIQVGPIDGQDNWSITNDEETENYYVSADLNATEGVNALRVDTGAAPDDFLHGVLSPLYNITGSLYTISQDIYIDELNANGSDAYLDQYAYNTTTQQLSLASRLIFSYDGTLVIADGFTTGTTINYEEVGEYTAGDWFNLKVEYNFTEGTINYFINSELVYEGTAWGAQVVNVFAYRHDNYLTGYNIDNIRFIAGTASVKPTTEVAVSVFPNPSNSIVNIANVEGLNSVALVDLNGRTVKNVSFNATSQAQVNISDLANGVYMMTINSDKGAVTKKIVKN